MVRRVPGPRFRGRAGERAGITVPPERNFPLPVVIGHGLFAVATLVLVVVTAIGEVGGS